MDRILQELLKQLDKWIRHLGHDIEELKYFEESLHEAVDDNFLKTDLEGILKTLEHDHKCIKDKSDMLKSYLKSQSKSQPKKKDDK